MSSIKKQLEQKIDLVNQVLKKAMVLERGVMIMAEQAERVKAKLDDLEARIDKLNGESNGEV